LGDPIKEGIGKETEAKRPLGRIRRSWENGKYNLKTEMA